MLGWVKVSWPLMIFFHVYIAPFCLDSERHAGKVGFMQHQVDMTDL